MKSQVERFGELIGYPERVPEGAVSFLFRVDDDPVEARAKAGTLLLKWTFPENAPVERLAEFAAGRILRDPAVLSWDPVCERAVLWRRTAKDAGDRELVRTFEEFIGSRGWWKACVAELTKPKATLQDLVIRP